MAEVAAQLDFVLPPGDVVGLRRDGVGHHQRAAGSQSALRFIQGRLEVAEVVGGLAAGDQVEAAVGEGQGLGGVLHQPDIGQPALTADAPGLPQHGLGDVAGEHPLGNLGNGEGGESRAGADVHGPAIGSAARLVSVDLRAVALSLSKGRVGQLLHRFQAVVADMDLALGVDPGLWAEHLLGQGAAGLFGSVRLVALLHIIGQSSQTASILH